MFAARLAFGALKPQNVNTILKSKSGSVSVSGIITRAFRHKVGSKTIKISTEKFGFSSSISGKSITIGEMAVAGGGVVGLGALCFYGLGFSNELGAIDNMVVWPPVVKERIRDTFLYFGASLAATATTAVAFYRSPMSTQFFNYCQRRPILSMVGILAALIGSSSAMQSIPYQSGLGIKQLFWLTNCGILGVALSSVGSFGGPLVIRAAWITAGMISGLSTVAVCAPSDKFLKWGAPLGLGLGGVVVASLGSAFLPAASAMALPLYSISVYGGLLIFSGFLLYDTQKIIRKAETHPVGYTMYPYDPLAASHMIVMDTVNIFVRIVQILAMGGGMRKK